MLSLNTETIINHCGDDFNACLIDDDSFSQLIPGWKINVSELLEPRKNVMLTGMTEQCYIYRLVAPNTFICMQFNRFATEH